MTDLQQHTAETHTPVRDPRTFISPEQWDKEIGLMCRDYPMDTVMAERVLGQAIAYLITSMECRGQGLGLAPGKLVDIGVHTMILDTVNYMEFCARYNHGDYLHHVPKIERKQDGSVMRTAEKIAERGFTVDWALWRVDAADCGPCHPGNDSH